MAKTDDRYFDRELSWLAFNGRVLQEAANPDVPLLERLKFLAIFSSNLDEFFRVRVASLRSLLRLKKKKRENLDFNPAKLLKRIHRVVHIQQQEFGEIFLGQILPELRREGIHLHAKGYLGIPNRAEFSAFFETRVRQHLHPFVLNQKKSGETFLVNRGLYMVVELWPESDSGFTPFEPDFGLVEIPSAEVGRFVVSSSNGKTEVVFLDDLIRRHLTDLFPGSEVGEAYSVKMTRDAELYLEDEFSGDLVEMIAKSLAKRESGLPTRFLYDPRMPYPMVTALKRVFDLDDEDLVAGGAYHNFSDFFSFPDFGRTDLQYPVWNPAPHPDLSERSSLFSTIRASDRLLHVPYQSIDPVIGFLNEAADDPAVKDVAITLYRVSGRSEVCAALIRAAQHDKRVTAFVEVKARFDEKPNIDWARRMEEAGVHVLYSKPGIKVHAKVALVGRIEPDGQKVDYAYLSTGNFNEKTARVYSDLGLFTADARLTSDLRELFELLRTDEDRDFSHLLVAPRFLRSEFEALIDREIAHARAGRPAGIVAKVNSLEDEKMIDKLYEASNEGVDIRLIVRGICRILPGVDGLSERIAVTSIVDRFLEHARIFRFENGGDSALYLASADWMKRNLSRRIEVAFPIYDQHVRDEVERALDIQLRDNTKARILDRKQLNRYVEAAEGDEMHRAQAETWAMYSGQWELGTEV